MTMTTAIAVPDAKPYHEESSPLLAKAKSLKVTTQAEHGVAMETLKALALRKRAIKERLDPLAEDAHKVHKGITSLRAELLAPIEQAEGYLGLECSGYEAIARQKAEEEARKKEAEAKKLEEDIKILQAEDAAAAGDAAGAEAILNETVEVPTIAVQPKLAKVEGASARTNYGAECFDLLALAKHCIAHPEDIALLQPNGPAINARARSQRDGFKLAGCRLTKNVVRSFKAI
jgi:hypothetical protein